MRSLSYKVKLQLGERERQRRQVSIGPGCRQACVKRSRTGRARVGVAPRRMILTGRQ